MMKPRRGNLTSERDSEERKPTRCPVCSRINPAEAYFCFFDGKPLFKDLQPMALPVGRLPFPAPFCFSDGQPCTNFNQLALACNNRWEEAREILAEAIWPTFFAAMGRLDLAAAARQAAKEPDRDRGLCQLLEKLPADPDFLRPPKLGLGSPEADLGQLVPGADHTFDLVILNQGMLLLHGVAASNSDWLVFGDHVEPLPAEIGPIKARPCDRLEHGERAGQAQKMFQTRNGCTIPVLVLGSKLRAGLMPMLGEIVIDTNGGANTLPVRAAIPIRAFPKGRYANDLLAGVTSPRELALKAREFPREVGTLFEQGAVKAWYASNGWTYPIEGFDTMGMATVQLFFETLGLTKPPHLEIDPNPLKFRGKIGERLSKRLTIRTKEAKAVYAQASANQDWVTLGPIKYLGAKAKIPVEVQVPASSEETVQAQVTVLGNGNQRFVVQVIVAVHRG